MGVLISNFRRSVTATLMGKQTKSLETKSGVADGIVDHITEGKEEGSKIDKSQYVTAFINVKPGTQVRVSGFGPDEIATLKALNHGDVVDVVMTQFGTKGTGYKLDELLVKSKAPIPVPPAPEASQPEAV